MKSEWTSVWVEAEGGPKEGGDEDLAKDSKKESALRLPKFRKCGISEKRTFRETDFLENQHRKVDFPGVSGH